METRANSFAVGLFVLIFGLGLLAFVVWLGHSQFSTHGKRYRLFFQTSVNGLQTGSPVRLFGVPVGTVAEIKLDRSGTAKVEIIIEIDPDVTIKSDTYAQSQLQGVTGSNYIELAGSTQDSAPVESRPGAGEIDLPVIPVRNSSLNSLVDQAPHLVEKLNTLADRLNTALSDENELALTHSLTNLDHLTSSLSATAPKLDATLDNANALMGELRQKTPALFNSLQISSGDFDQLLQENRKPIHDFTGDGLYELSGLVGDLRTMAQSITRLSQRIEQNPRQILFGVKGGENPP